MLFNCVTGRFACLSKASLAPSVGSPKCLTAFREIIRGGGGEISPACSFLLKEIAEGQGVVCGLCSTSPNEITRQQHLVVTRFSVNYSSSLSKSCLFFKSWLFFGILIS